jgi:hypothetical protein
MRLNECVSECISKGPVKDTEAERLAHLAVVTTDAIRGTLGPWNQFTGGGVAARIVTLLDIQRDRHLIFHPKP